MVALLAGPNLELPWSSTQQDDKRYWRVLMALLVPFLILSIVIPLINVPEPKREELEKLPPQLAKVVLKKKELPPPPPPPPPKEEKKPEEKKPEPKPVEKKPEPKPVEKKPEPDPIKLKQAQEQAKKSGVLQFADDLADMRDALDVSEVKPASQNITRAKADAAKVERNFINSGAKAKSGGVNTAALSRDTGGAALSGKETTVVESKLEDVSAAAVAAREQSARDKSYRGDQAIRQKMDEAKGRIFSIYNRALRKNPTLQGTVMFKLVIEPDGTVSDAKIVSSELNDADLERKLLAAIRFINFGSSDVLQTTLNYSFDFLPY